jgi:hypothetical protein
VSYRQMAVMVLVALSAATASASVEELQAGGGSLRGVWKVTHATDAAGKTIDWSRPSLIIFTERHYSLFIVGGDRPRYEQQQPTPQQKAATLDAISTNGGTYEVKGNKLTMMRTVAKNLFAEGSSQTVEYRIEGNTLELLYPDTGGSHTLTRLE